MPNKPTPLVERMKTLIAAQAAMRKAAKTVSEELAEEEEE